MASVKTFLFVFGIIIMIIGIVWIPIALFGGFGAFMDGRGNAGASLFESIPVAFFMFIVGIVLALVFRKR